MAQMGDAAIQHIRAALTAEWLDQWEAIHNTAVVSFGEAGPERAVKRWELIAEVKSSLRGSDG